MTSAAQSSQAGIRLTQPLKVETSPFIFSETVRFQDSSWGKPSLGWSWILHHAYIWYSEITHSGRTDWQVFWATEPFSYRKLHFIHLGPAGTAPITCRIYIFYYYSFDQQERRENQIKHCSLETSPTLFRFRSAIAKLDHKCLTRHKRTSLCCHTQAKVLVRYLCHHQKCSLDVSSRLSIFHLLGHRTKQTHWCSDDFGENEGNTKGDKKAM